MENKQLSKEQKLHDLALAYTLYLSLNNSDEVLTDDEFFQQYEQAYANMESNLGSRV